MHYRDLLKKGATQAFEASRPQMERLFPDVANKETLIDDYRDKLLGMLQSPELTDALISIYAKYLSDDDVKSLIQFYETPADQHFNSAEENLTSELRQAANQIGREHTAEINKEFCGEHPELQGKTSLCPAPAGDGSASH